MQCNSAFLTIAISVDDLIIDNALNKMLKPNSKKSAWTDDHDEQVKVNITAGKRQTLVFEVY